MEKYIERLVLSIINQNFQDFEIIIVNDKSNDQTENIIQRIKMKDSRIKVINHLNNQGVYNSRVDAVFASKGKYIILMDPDDMFLNPNLFYEIYNYNLKFNLDIIEFTVFSYNETKSYLTKKLSKYHYHNLKGIINQPQLSTIFFFDSNNKNFTSVRCRNIWNKSIRREIVLNTIKKYFS
jgi:glycosyltransferase involved in cell wall biosynthesis